MAKSTRAETAARAAQLRAEAARKDRQRTQVIAASVAVVVVIIAVVLGVVISNRPKDAPAATAGSGGAAALATLEKLPASLFDKAPAPSPAQAPAKLQGGTPLTQDGKPKVLYIGAEYCPYCAAQRWALAVALSRFGTFDKLARTSPERVARTVLDAVAKNKARVLPGIDAKVYDLVVRLTGSGYMRVLLPIHRRISPPTR